MNCYYCWQAKTTFSRCPAHGLTVRVVKVTHIILQPIKTTGHSCPCGEYNCSNFCINDLSEMRIGNSPATALTNQGSNLK